MQMASSASWTCMEFASASEYTATVRIFSSLQARMILTAISPRLATRSFSNIQFRLSAKQMPTLSSARTNLEQGLAEFDRLGIFNQHLRNDAFGFGLDLIHHFHGLNDAHHGLRPNFCSDLDVGC